MSGRVLTTNAGELRPVPGLKQPSAIHKHPVERIEVRDPGPKQGGLGSGVVGDEIGSHKHHGGSTQAVYAVAREELDWWGEELGRELPNGWFGENLTTTGLEVDEALIGEMWQIGTTRLEVCAPRIPCATFAKHMGERAWVRRFAERGRTGAYLAVSEPGIVEPGLAVEVVERPEHGLTLVDYFRAMMGDKELARRILALDVLRPAESRWLARRT